MTKDPAKTIKEYRKKGYIVSLHVDSTRPIYAVEMTAQNDVQRFTVPIEKVAFKTLLDAVRG